MKNYAYGTRAARRLRITLPAFGFFVLASILALTLAGASGAAATSVPLGSAFSFAVLAGAGVTNTGPTTLNGDIGTFPTTTITGTGTMTVNGANHAGDAVTQQAKTDLVTAYNNAAAQGPTNPIVADLGGQTLTAGVYNSASTIGLTGALTLNGSGDPDAIFVFQAGSALTTASASSVNLINGAQACNVFWQVGSDATLGTGSSFVGTVIALSSITVTTGTTIRGRVLARNGTVTLDTNTITKSTCRAPAPPSASPTATREIYCLGGTPYDLVVGQDKLPPYDKLGLTASFIDPVTGAKTCSAATTPTATTPTATTPTATTPTATTPTPTPAGPTAKQIAAAKAKRLAAVKAKQIALAKARRLAAARSAAIAKAKPKPRAATTTTFGFTG